MNMGNADFCTNNCYVCSYKQDCNSTFSDIPTKQCPHTHTHKKNPPNLKFPNLKKSPGSQFFNCFCPPLLSKTQEHPTLRMSRWGATWSVFQHTCSPRLLPVPFPNHSALLHPLLSVAGLLHSHDSDDHYEASIFQTLKGQQFFLIKFILLLVSQSHTEGTV